MDIKEYYIRQIAKTNKKNYENYIVTRLLARLDNSTVKFITQQAVRSADSNKRFLTDIYFPQIDLHIEIDEGHHKWQKTEDVAREADIVRVTSHDIHRIDATTSLADIHTHIDEILTNIKSRIQKQKDRGAFTPWDIEREFDPKFYIEKGYIDLAEKVSFRTMVDASSCFGRIFKPKSIWRGAIKHPREEKAILWFPKLYEYGVWDNKLSDDGKTIWEKNKSGDDIERNIAWGEDKNIIVFAHAKDSLGAVLYRFNGVFKMNVDETRKTNVSTFCRTGTRVKTYIPKE